MVKQCPVIALVQPAAEHARAVLEIAFCRLRGVEAVLLSGHQVGLGPCQVKVKDFQERLSRLERVRERSVQELCQAFRQAEPHRGTAQAER